MRRALLIMAVIAWASITHPLKPEISVHVPDTITLRVDAGVAVVPAPLQVNVEGIPSLVPLVPSNVRVVIAPTIPPLPEPTVHVVVTPAP